LIITQKNFFTSLTYVLQLTRLTSLDIRDFKFYIFLVLWWLDSCSFFIVAICCLLFWSSC